MVAQVASLPMAELRETLEQKIAPIKAPIAGAEPQGMDASYEPDFEEVQTEITKLGSLDGSTPDWGKVATASMELLSSKTKDFRLATWGAVALTIKDGPAGLAEGLLITLEVAKQYWDTMYPPLKRARARGNQASWVSEQSEQILAEYAVKASDREALALCEALYGELDDFLTEKLGDNYPGMGPLRGVLRNKSRELPAEKPPEPAAPPPPAPGQAPAAAPPPVAQAAAAAPAAMATPQDASKALKPTCMELRKIAMLLRKGDPAAAIPYRIYRFALWVEVAGTPPAEGNATRLPPPTPDKRQRMETLLSASNWVELIDVAEGHAAAHLFWLDAHRYTATALDRLGALATGAREVVGREVVAFVERFPALLNLKFADGTDFADAATKTWIEEEQAKYAGGGGGPSAAASAGAEEDQLLAERFEHAKELVLGGQVSDGLGVAIALANRGADARTRFRARLSVARLAIQAGQMPIARPILEALSEEVEAHQLEIWEPELTSRVYVSLLTCLASARDKPVAPGPPGTKTEPRAEVAKFAALFDKLCRLDPAAAMGLAG